MDQWPADTDRLVYDQLDSTNEEAKRIAEQKLRSVWILAHNQTNGRGRRGRVWSAPHGNFSASLLLPIAPETTLLTAALYSFVTSLALHETLAKLTNRSDIFLLKWPNDVLLHEQKLSGILLETVLDSQSNLTAIIIGVGCNLSHAPQVDQLEPSALPAISLRESTGVIIDPESFLSAFAPIFSQYSHQFQTFGFAPILHAWLTRAARIGDEITAKTLRETIKGRFDTVDIEGNLVLTTAQGTVKIPAADIYFEEGQDALSD